MNYAINTWWSTFDISHDVTRMYQIFVSSRAPSCYNVFDLLICWWGSGRDCNSGGITTMMCAKAGKYFNTVIIIDKRLLFCMLLSKRFGGRLPQCGVGGDGFESKDKGGNIAADFGGMCCRRWSHVGSETGVKHSLGLPIAVLGCNTAHAGWRFDTLPTF